jgi:hypothetical protein
MNTVPRSEPVTEFEGVGGGRGCGDRTLFGQMSPTQPYYYSTIYAANIKETNPSQEDITIRCTST